MPTLTEEELDYLKRLLIGRTIDLAKEVTSTAVDEEAMVADILSKLQSN